MTHSSRRKFLVSAGVVGSGLLLSKLPFGLKITRASDDAPEQTSVTARTTVATRLRAGPGTEYKQIGTIPIHTTVPVYGRNAESNWIYVEYGGKRGWSAAWLFTIQGDLASVPVVEPDGAGSEPAPPPEEPESPPPGEPEAPPPGPAPPGVMHWDGSPMGRILLNIMTIYAEPTWRGKFAGSLYYNDVVPIHGAVTGEGLYPTNNTWLQVDDGYIYSSWVQPAGNNASNPTSSIGEGGVWGMITVPITYSHTRPSDDAPTRERMYYSEVHRLVGVENGFYKVAEVYGDEYWLKAAHVRIIPPDEVTPLSAHIPPEEKRIEISVGDQMLRAYEGNQLVFETMVSTGTTSSQTPFGEFRIRDKRHGQRMTGGLTGGGYNLAGIPYIAYFTNSWVALHGCYWHNDYGRRHSNGCVNMHPLDAKWLFQWSTPVANYWSFNTVPGDGQPGTRVIVAW